MTQEILAAHASITRVNLSRIERGLQEPGCRAMTRIAHALGMKLSELVDGID